MSVYMIRHVLGRMKLPMCVDQVRGELVHAIPRAAYGVFPLEEAERLVRQQKCPGDFEILGATEYDAELTDQEQREARAIELAEQRRRDAAQRDAARRAKRTAPPPEEA